MGNTDKRNGKPYYNYVLMGYTHVGTQNFTHDIESKKKKFKDMRIGVRAKSGIICTGIYSKVEKGSEDSGLSMSHCQRRYYVRV